MSDTTSLFGLAGLVFPPIRGLKPALATRRADAKLKHKPSKKKAISYKRESGVFPKIAAAIVFL
jgi:hypothetical protein